MSDYQRGLDEGRNEQHSYQASRQLGQGLGQLIGWVLVAGSRVVVEVLLAAPFLMLGFVVMAPLDFLGPVLGAVRLLGIGVLAYLFYAGLYWLKGLVVAQHRREGWLWLLPFSVCVAVTCLLPGWLVRMFITSSFPPASPLWGWGLGIAFALFAYGRYRFTEDIAPSLALWSYRRGYNWALR